MKKNTYNSIVIVTIAVVAIAAIAIYAISRNYGGMNDNMMSQSANTNTDTNSTGSSKYATLKGEDFDEAYIADMLAHHEGAIAMSEMAGAGSDRKEILDLSQAIMQSQSQELVLMQELQSKCGYVLTMGGHASHSGMGNEMSGEMMNMGEGLKDLKGSEFDKMFLELMIEHHQQAIDMSQYADENAGHQEIKDLAKAVIVAQKAEIIQMKQWQKDWGYAVSSDSSMPRMNH